MPTARMAGPLAMVGLGLLSVALVGRPAPDGAPQRPALAETAPRHPSFSAIGLSSRPRPLDPIAEFMRRGPMPDAATPKGWVPDTMVAPAICRLPVPARNWRVAPEMNPLAPVARSRRGGKGRAADRLARGAGTGRAALFRAAPRIAFASDQFGGRRTQAKASAFTDLPPLVVAELEATSVSSSTVQGLGNPVPNAENRRAAPIGTAASALQFDDRPGQLSAAAQAGLWNGAPATAMGVGYTLPNRVRLDAAGVTNVNAWANIGKTLQVSAVASVPLE